MKKVVLVVSIILFAALLSINVFAEGTNYSLDELDLSVNVPSDWITFTRDIYDSDPNLNLLGVTAYQLKELYIQNHQYLDSICIDPYCEIVVSMTDTSSEHKIFNYNDYRGSQLLDASIEDLTDLNGMTFSDPTIYQNSQATFIVYNCWQYNGTDKIYSRLYCTVYNGKSINISLHSYTGAITDSMLNTLKATVDNSHFTRTLDNPYDIPTRNNEPVISFSRIMAEFVSKAIVVGILGGLILLIRMLVKKNNKKQIK